MASPCVTFRHQLRRLLMTTRPFANAVMYSYFSENGDAVVHVTAPDRAIDWWEARIFHLIDGRIEGGDMFTACWEALADVASWSYIDMPERPPHEA